MPKLTCLLSLPTDDNDFQQEQAAAAKETALRLGLDLQVVYAGNDAIKQSDQLLKSIQSPAGARPDAILFEPLGATSLPQVAPAGSSVFAAGGPRGICGRNWMGRTESQRGIFT